MSKIKQVIVECDHPPAVLADAYSIAETLIKDGFEVAEKQLQKVILERKLLRWEAVVLAETALKFSIRFQHNFERKVNHV